MSETITIYCKNNNTYKEVPIGSSLLDIYSLVGAPLRFVSYTHLTLPTTSRV